MTKPFIARFNSLFHTIVAVMFIATLPSCNTQTGQSTAHTDTTMATTVPVADSTAAPADSTDMAMLWFTIADTSNSYALLAAKMYALQKTLGWPIDTMGRYYNPKKDLIAVPDNDEDEMYRGEYYPRRYPSQNLSLEYYQTYMPNSTEKNIALVAGIYETQQSADSLLLLLKPAALHAFVVKANVFEGCMH
ncbi:MAG: hypothetical protein JWQ38_535 [Flavipsychrobacter sp.]|nr:hypothetical protein [Flavipsychrobacter sp.]